MEIPKNHRLRVASVEDYDRVHPLLAQDACLTPDGRYKLIGLDTMDTGCLISEIHIATRHIDLEVDVQAMQQLPPLLCALLQCSQWIKAGFDIHRTLLHIAKTFHVDAVGGQDLHHVTALHLGQCQDPQQLLARYQQNDSRLQWPSDMTQTSNAYRQLRWLHAQMNMTAVQPQKTPEVEAVEQYQQRQRLKRRLHEHQQEKHPNYVSFVNDVSNITGIRVDYEELEQLLQGDTPSFQIKCRYNHPSSPITATGLGRAKKEAKQTAALTVYELIVHRCRYSDVNCT